MGFGSSGKLPLNMYCLILTVFNQNQFIFSSDYYIAWPSIHAGEGAVKFVERRMLVFFKFIFEFKN